MGVIGGYISLWLSVCQAIYTGLVLLYEYTIGKKESPSKLDQDDDGNELVAAHDEWKEAGFKTRTYNHESSL